MSPTTYIDKEHSKRKHLFSQTIFSSHPIIQFHLTATCSTVSSTLYIPLVLSRKDLATEGSVSSITLSWLLWLELGSSLLLISCNTHNEIKWIKQEKYKKKTIERWVVHFRCSEMQFLAFSWRYFLYKISFEKGQKLRIQGIWKKYFQFLSYRSSIIENVLHCPNPMPLLKLQPQLP